MMTAHHRLTIPGAVRTGGAAIALILLAAACSSGGSKTSNGTNNSNNASLSNTATGSAGATAAASMATVSTRSGPFGRYLVDGTGRTLYLFASDGANRSTCTGSCLTYWPPLTSTGKPSAVGGVLAGRLATFAGPAGSSWVSYAGHPLYYFALDKAAGDIKGQGSNNFGAKWWLVAPSGQPITAGGSSSAASSSSGGGYGGGGYGG